MQKVEDSKDILKNRRELQGIKLELKDLEINLENHKQEIKIIEGISEEDRTEIQKDRLKLLKIKVENIKEEMKKLVEKAKEIRANFFDTEKLFDEKEKQKLEEQEKRQKETLEFIHSIGFDLIPQEVSEDIIKTVNLDKGVFGLQENIDLKN
jgi:hypothetical protein